jgi:hypothetical protein
MKKINILTMLMLIISTISTAQTIGERGISTDPRAPINPDINSPAGGGIAATTPTVENNFYWFNTNANPPFNNKWFTFTYNNGPGFDTSSIKSPYFQATSGLYVFAKTDEVSGNDNSDYLPEDGWELIKVDLGRLADDVTPRLNISELGYIALYNRYTGTMRFLGSLSKFSSTNKTVKFNIRLLRHKEESRPDQFSNENTIVAKRTTYYQDVVVTNLLSLHDEALQPLDQKTSVINASVMANIPGNNQSNYFFWFDIPMAYDPCICKGKAMLALSYEEIDNWTFSATGTLLGNYTAGPSADADCHNNIPGQIIGGVVATGQAIATNGASIVSSTGSFIGVIKAASCALGMTPKDQKVLKVFGDVVENSATVIDAANSIKPSSPKKTDKLKAIYISGTDTIKRSDIAAVIGKSTKFLSSLYSLDNVLTAKEVKKTGGLQNNIQATINPSGTMGNKIYNWRDALIAVGVLILWMKK